MIEQISDGSVRGYLEMPAQKPEAGIVLAHGASSNGNSRILVSIAEGFLRAGLATLRIDLPFRQRSRGSPHPSTAGKDREGIADAVALLRTRVGRVFLGGHSYGGRQASMLTAEQPDTAPALLLLSYPLHPPGKPEQLRTAHFPSLTTPCMFVHGSRDPFGSPDELRGAIPAKAELLLIEKAGHELKPVLTKPDPVVAAFLDYVSRSGV